MISKVLLLASLGQAHAATLLSLPDCACQDTWEGSDDATGWAATWGTWGIPNSVRGCFHDTVYHMGFCLPNTSAGACIAEGSFDASFSKGYMACGTWEQVGATKNVNISAPTPPLDSGMKAMAFQFAKSLKETLVPKPMCNCSSDWSMGELAALYCGDYKGLAKGPVNSTLCPNTPAIISNGKYIDTDTPLPGTWCSTGMKITSTGLQYLNGTSVPSSASCDLQDAQVAPCAGGEVLMSYPNTRKEAGAVDANLLMATARTHARSTSPRGVNGGYSLMTFPPSSILSTPHSWANWMTEEINACYADTTCTGLLENAETALVTLQMEAASKLEAQQNKTAEDKKAACSASAEAMERCANETKKEEADKAALINRTDTECAIATAAAAADKVTKCKQTWARERLATQAAAMKSASNCTAIKAATQAKMLPISCADMKNMYSQQKCCESPSQPFQLVPPSAAKSRRLSDIRSDVDATLSRVLAEEGRESATQLAAEIIKLAKTFRAE